MNSHDTPIYWKCLNKVSTMTCSDEGLLMNQYQTSDPFGIIPAGQIVNGTTILESLNINTTPIYWRWEKVLVMLGWAVLYRIFFLHSSSILFKEPEVIENHIGEVEVPSLELQMRSCYPFICSYILRSFALIPLEKQ